MKRQYYAVATLVAASFGISAIATMLSQAPAFADRPGYRPSTTTTTGSSPTSGNGGSTAGSGGELISTDPEQRIYVYPSPSSDVDPIGYGFAGDAVTIFDSVSGWSYVQFERSGARGWVQSSAVDPA